MYATQGLLADPRPVDTKWSGGFRLEVLVASEPALIGWLAWLRSSGRAAICDTVILIAGLETIMQKPYHRFPSSAGPGSGNAIDKHSATSVLETPNPLRSSFGSAG